MRNEELFNKFCINAGIGSRFDIENHPESPAFPTYQRIRFHADSLIDSAREFNSKLPPIHFNFVDSSIINACAFKYDSKYFIAINTGVVSILSLIIQRILATPSTFPFIGDPSKEKDNLPVIDWSILNPEKLFNLGVRPDSPQDTNRRLYAVHLFEQAVLFLVGHEIAHISRGHVDYFNANSDSSFLPELGWTGTGEEKIERQALEVDADRRSIYARCDTMFKYTEAANSFHFPWLISIPFQYLFQQDCALSTSVLFRMFGDEQFSGIDLSKDSYPPLALRRRLALDSAAFYLDSMWEGVNQDVISNVLQNALAQSESCFKAIGAKPSNGGISDAFSEEANKHVKLISDCWENMKEKLRKYSFEDL